jgi:hypothetical protein
MLRVRLEDGPRKGEIVEVACDAGWAMLADGRASDPRVPTPSSPSEVSAPSVVVEVKPANAPRRGNRR